jgi:hypothetical protein
MIARKKMEEHANRKKEEASEIRREIRKQLKNRTKMDRLLMKQKRQ